MSIMVNALDSKRATNQLYIISRPDSCPLCHHAMSLAGELVASYNEAKHILELVHRCPRLACQSLFIANYQRTPNGHFGFTHAKPYNFAPRPFKDIIKNISTEFCEIYNQALASESNGQLKICGVGYRKALEFLMKDYLIGLHPHKADEIKSKLLGKCIDEYVSNANIKAVAKRAVWLGNDETHYVRLWEGKDLQDLKGLIDLTVHWIEMEQLTASALKDMPDT
jgi:hypothetical protein